MVLKIGHRGAAGYEPGNTLSSFRKAVELKADMIELDVYYFKGQYVVSHDFPKGDMLTLQEVVDEFKGKIKFNIEVKDGSQEIFKFVKKNKIEKDVIISSNIALKHKNIDTALIYYATKTDLGQFFFNLFSLLFFPLTKRNILKKAKGVRYIHLHYSFATKRFVQELHQLGYKVNVWTVNSIRSIKRMKKNKVDGIISNYPDRI